MSFDPTDSGTVMVDCVPIRRRLSRSGPDGTSSIRLTADVAGFDLRQEPRQVLRVPRARPAGARASGCRPGTTGACR